jgi:hypothetical protein
MSGKPPGSVKSRVRVTGTVLVILVAALPVWGALGGDVSSVQTDQLHMQGTRQMTAKQSYTVYELRAATGTVVREYASPTGTVFAVAWQGPWLPDMRQLLGSYFEQYAQAAKTQSGARMGRRPLMIEQPGLVVESGGHPRAFVGKAYVPEMLPQGVRAEELQ